AIRRNECAPRPSSSKARMCRCFLNPPPLPSLSLTRRDLSRPTEAWGETQAPCCLYSIGASAPPPDRSGASHRSTALLPAALACGVFGDSRREEGSDRQLFLQAIRADLVL